MNMIRQNLLRYITALMMCCSSLVATAELVNVFAEPFDGVVVNQIPVITGWSFVNCTGTNKTGNAGNTCLRVGNTNNTGRATTKALGVSGTCKLSFSYANATRNYSTLTVSLLGNGSIDGTTSFSPTTTEHTSVTVTLTGVTEETQIVFEGTAGGIAIDDVVVKREVLNFCAPPTFSLAEGYYKTAQTLTMSCATEGATIYYTTDGTAPTDQSTQYSGEISIGETQTVKAIAYKGETASEVASAYYYVGDFLYADAFTANEHGDSTVASNFVLSNLNIGRSAILTFRAKGTTASSTLNVRALENNEGTPICDKTIDLTKDVWLSDTIALPTLKEGSTMTIYFNNGSFAIDDILLVTPLTITLSENASNTETLQNNRGKIVDVATVRTLRGGIWNTLCLPFAVSRSVLYTGIGGSQNCYITTYDHFADNIMTFRTAVGAEVIPAGTPFLVKIDNTVTNPVFRAVTITVTAPLFIADGGVTFQGCFNPTPLEYNGTDLFIGTDNFLYVPAEATRTLGGLRAFVHRANSQTRLSLAFDDETTAIRQADILPMEAEALYTLQGQRVVCPGRGLYIKDGKKIFIK